VGILARFVREPLLIPLSAIAAGICISQFASFSLLESLGSAAALGLLAIITHRLGSPTLAHVVTTIAFLACGVALDVVHRPGPTPEIDASSQETVILGGCVVEPPILTADREHFVLELAPRAYANVSLSLRPNEHAPDLVYGQKIEVDAKVRRPRNFGNPGAFDYVRYLARQNVYWTASAGSGAQITTLPGACGSRALGIVYKLRVAALSRLERLYAGNDYAIAMMEATLLGESSKLEKVWTDHFRRTGTYHALVISGLHVTVLAGVLLFLLRLLMLNEMAALVIAAIAAWVYAAVSGWSAPVIRAAGGFTLYLGCRYFYRKGRLLNLLAAVGIGYVIYDPRQIFEASFQLSFLSVAAIGAFAIPLLDRTSGLYRDAPRALADSGWDARMQRHSAALRVELRLIAETVSLWTSIPDRYTLAVLSAAIRFALWVYEMVVVSAVIQVALALPMALYFHRISITGLSANLLIVPLLSAVVPIGFGAIFTNWQWLAWTASRLLAWSESVAEWHVRFEPLTRVPDAPIWLACMFVATLILCAIALRANSAWQWPAMMAVFGYFTVILWYPYSPALIPGVLEMTAVDVGQGDSLFIAFPNGRTMIVDAGGIPAFGRRTKPRIDIGEDVVSPYLWSRQIRRVDVIAVTHAHEDHVGGLKALLENFRPAELWTGATPESAAWMALEQRARDLGIRIVHRHSHEQVAIGAARLDVLAPLPDYEPAEIAKNNDSLVMRLAFGAHSFLLTGDVEKQIEGQLVAANALSKITVLKVAHHGSRTSSIESFLEATQPAVAVISAGFENSFRHPHPDILDRLGSHHAAILRTDQSGLITVLTDGHRLTIHTNAWEAGSPFTLLPMFDRH
jgi:competence protein ComEC